MSQPSAEAIAKAITDRAVLPAFEGECSLEEAYRLQAEVVARRAVEGVGGIKAGVTAPALQRFFGLEHAVLGSLYADGRLENGCSIDYVEGRNLECEVAILVDGEGLPQAIAPSIEVVLLRFARTEDASAANLVSANVGADAYIVGEFVDWDPAFNALRVELRRGDERLNEASLEDALGGPESGTHWIVGEARRRGFACEEGTLLLGGACGTVVPAEPGHYTADYGPLGRLHFEIR